MNIELWQIVLLCIAAFCAGFIDAIVGGGGLVQLPAALVILNTFPVVSLRAEVLRLESLAQAFYHGTVRYTSYQRPSAQRR